MKDSRTIRKVLFLSNRDIALVVFDVLDNKRVILFADQINLDSADLNVKINELLSNAANFLGFIIKEVEVVFEDSNIKKIEAKYVLHDCVDQTEVANAIYKKSKVDKFYVNEIFFNSIEYDDVSKNANVDCSVMASDYNTYKRFVEAVKVCNVNVINASNIYTLINNKSASSQIIISAVNNQFIVSEYALGCLNRIFNLKFNTNEIYLNLANKFKTNVNSIKQMVNIVNAIEADNENKTIVSLSYDLAHKKFSSVLAKEIVNEYQKEVNNLISRHFNLNNYSEVSVITDKVINKLNNARVLSIDQTIGLEALNPAKLIAYSKLDVNAKEVSQTKFEISVNTKIHSIVL